MSLSYERKESLLREAALLLRLVGLNVNIQSLEGRQEKQHQTTSELNLGGLLPGIFTCRMCRDSS